MVLSIGKAYQIRGCSKVVLFGLCLKGNRDCPIYRDHVFCCVFRETDLYLFATALWR